MIEVLIVGGFLGAGKTTWLGNYLGTQRLGNTTIIVNEFARIDVDGATLEEDSGRIGMQWNTVSILDGCVCCTKLDALRSELRSAVATAHGVHPRDRHGERDMVVIETSGLADPASVIKLLTSDPMLATNLSLLDVVVVVDAVDGVRQLHHKRLARRQVQSAGRVVVAKSDLVDAEELIAVVGTVLRINPGVPIAVANDGVESEVTATSSELLVVDDDEAVEAPSALIMRIPGDVSWAEYALWLEAVTRLHPDKFLRSKGIISTPSGQLIVQSVGSTIARPRHVTGSAAETEVVLIYCGIEREQIARSLQAFVAGATVVDSL